MWTERTVRSRAAWVPKRPLTSPRLLDVTARGASTSANSLERFNADSLKSRTRLRGKCIEASIPMTSVLCEACVYRSRKCLSILATHSYICGRAFQVHSPFSTNPVGDRHQIHRCTKSEFFVQRGWIGCVHFTRLLRRRLSRIRPQQTSFFSPQASALGFRLAGIFK